MRLEGIQTRARAVARKKYPNFDDLPRKKRGNIINSLVNAELEKYPELRQEIEKREAEQQERMMRPTMIVDDELKYLLEQGIYFDGAHHKQWCLVQIARKLGVELEEGSYEEGIAP